MKTAGVFLIATLLTAHNSALAQTRYGTVFLNNYDSGKGLFDILPCGAPAHVGTMVEVLGGPTGGALSPIATATGVSKYIIVTEDLNANGPNSGSFFDYGFGEVRGTFPTAVATLQLRLWRGASTYDAALTRASVSWQQATGTNPDLPFLPSPAVLQIPGSVRFTLAGAHHVHVSPSSQIVLAKATVTFNLPLEPFDYQWRKDGLNLNGATNATLTLTNVSRADAGVYDAGITNPPCADFFVCLPGLLRVVVPQQFEMPIFLNDGRVRLPFRDHDGNVAPYAYATNYFTIQASTNLVDWQAVSGSLSLTNGFLVFEENTPLAAASRFYRIIER